MLNIRQIQNRSSRSLLSASLIIVCLSVCAQTITERHHLSLLSTEIQHLELLIQRAEVARSSHQRLQFRYDWLRRDLKRIQEGIDSYIEEYNLTPRTFPPLQGDYVQ